MRFRWVGRPRQVKGRRLVFAVTILVMLMLVVIIRFHTPTKTEAKLGRTALISIIAGALTGIVETTIMYPVENVKTQQQLTHESISETLSRTWQHHGWKGFYRGITPVIIGAVPTQALRWGSFEVFCHFLGCHSIANIFWGGLASGILVASITGVPIETLKTSMIHTITTPAASPAATPPPPGSPSKKSPPSMLLTPVFGTPTSTLEEHFKGWAPTMAKKITNQAIRFPAHAFFVALLCSTFVVHGPALGSTSSLSPTTLAPSTHQHVSECAPAQHPVMSFFAGMLAGMSSILITQPFDVVKTRMQGLSAHRYGGFMDCVRILAREEGLRVFMSGIVSRSVRVSLGAGVTFTAFPILKQHVAHWF